MSLLSALSEGVPEAGISVAGTSAVQLGQTDPTAAGSRAVGRGAAQDVYFFTSIEDFPPGIGDLSQTHDDAQGFYDYVRQFNTPNAWYRDGSVGQWIYEEAYDNYLDDYGFDSARVSYHAGHGDMDANGVFWIPVGNDWGGDTWTSSNDMRLGNEYARYLFWSTCFSLRVKDGHTPIRTWSGANLGVRMIFGYETVSIDSGDYGKFFFQEWNKGKSFSTAFLDASWRISTSQEPAVSACGATQAEASDRVFNERTFESARANTSWWWWRWYNAARARTRNLQIPDGARSAKLEATSERELAQWADRFGVAVPSELQDRASLHGSVIRGEGDTRISFSPDGTRDVRLSTPADTRVQIGTEQAVKAARRAVEQYRLADSVDLVLDSVRYDRHAGASADEQVDEAVREITVSFVQVMDHVPVVTPGAGQVQIRIDNEGSVTGVVDSTRQVQELRAEALAPAQPDSRRSRAPRERTALAGLNGDGSRTAESREIDHLLDSALQRRVRRAAAGGRFPTNARAVPGTSEIGYALRDGHAELVARREVDLDFGQGLAKRYVLEEPV